MVSMNVKKRIALCLCFIILAAGIFCVGVNVYMVLYAKPYIYSDVEALPKNKYTVILPGAKVYSNNVSHVVRDRIEGSLQCLNAGKAKKILVSGDHGRKEYDEVNEIRKYMQSVYGTDGSLIFMDHAGISTYDSVYRAKKIFEANNILLVTQKYHLYR